MQKPTPNTQNVMQPVYAQPGAENAQAAVQSGAQTVAQAVVQTAAQPAPHHAAHPQNGELHHNHQPKPKPKRHLFRRFVRGYLMLVGALVNIFVLVQAIVLLLEFLGEHINVV